MGLRFGGLGIFVKDLKTMVEFYRNLFSVSIEWDGNDPYAQFEHMGIMELGLWSTHGMRHGE